MPIPADVEKYIARKFAASDGEAVRALLNDATIHDGSPAGPRLVRCAVVVSRGSLKQLRDLIELLKLDYRDVIVAGEYELQNGQLVQVRDLNQPIQDEA